MTVVCSFYGQEWVKVRKCSFLIGMITIHAILFFWFILWGIDSTFDHYSKVSTVVVLSSQAVLTTSKCFYHTTSEIQHK